MKEAYTKLMLQQNISADAEKAFYEKLEQAKPVKKARPVWKAAVIAACVLLLIPVTVWAVENIFGVALIARFEGTLHNGRDAIGYQTQFENVENIPITEFSQYAQELKESVVAYYDSWEEAAQEIGIDLLSNSVLADEGTYPMKSYYTGKNPPAEHCEAIYYVDDGHLYAVKASAMYHRNDVYFGVTATMTTDHPIMTDEIFQIYHGAGVKYYQANKTEISEEHFTTENGIPVTIVTPVTNAHSWSEAFFAVNNVTYKVTITGVHYDNTVSDPWAITKDILMEVLEGFTLE